MNIPRPRLAGLNSARFRDVQDKLDRLHPQTAPGVLTDYTTRGTVRRVSRKNRNSGGTGGSEARWA